MKISVWARYGEIWAVLEEGFPQAGDGLMLVTDAPAEVFSSPGFVHCAFWLCDVPILAAVCIILVASSRLVAQEMRLYTVYIYIYI